MVRRGVHRRCVHRCGDDGRGLTRLQREPERVLADIVDGKVTPERARGVYGVVVDVERRRVDEVPTNALRARRKGEHDS